MSDTTLLEFPCRFPIKAFGKKNTKFEDTVFNLVKPHAPELQVDDLSCKFSSSRHYVSVTVNITARSKAQVDAIYQDLSDHSAVLMAL